MEKKKNFLIVNTIGLSNRMPQKGENWQIKRSLFNGAPPSKKKNNRKNSISFEGAAQPAHDAGLF